MSEHVTTSEAIGLTSHSTGLDGLKGTNDNKPRAHILNLPAELLNDIITRVVVDPGKVHRIIDWSGYNRIDRPILRALSSSSPALSRTCAALRKAVSPIYYGQNLFGFIAPADAIHFLDGGRQNRVNGIALRDILLCDYTRSMNATSHLIGYDFPLQDMQQSEGLRLQIEDGSDELTVSCFEDYMVLCGDCKLFAQSKVKEINNSYQAIGCD